MKKSKSFLLLIVGAVVVLTYYSLQESQVNENYPAEIQKFRDEKNQQMVTEGFPFFQTEGDFHGLNYFDPDPTYRISAELTPIKTKNTMLLSTNDGKESQYLEYAYADFAINQTKCRLLILEVIETGPGRGALFLAFADETSARETYGAGRYLDINKVPGSTSVLLDFNKAYNPYCAYSDQYSCPFPPKENILPVPIYAGEKVYK